MSLRARVRVAGNEVIHGSLRTTVRASKFILRETESHARVLVRGGRCSYCSFQKLTAATGSVDQRGQSRPVRRHLILQWAPSQVQRQERALLEASDPVNAGTGVPIQAPWFTAFTAQKPPPCFLWLSSWGGSGVVQAVCREFYQLLSS